jgi:hypothetical protein
MGCLTRNMKPHDTWVAGAAPVIPKFSVTKNKRIFTSWPFVVFACLVKCLLQLFHWARDMFWLRVSALEAFSVPDRDKPFEGIE